MRDLVDQDGEGGEQADARAGQEAAADRQAVGEVVHAVGQQVQVAGSLQIATSVRRGDYGEWDSLEQDECEQRSAG